MSKSKLDQSNSNDHRFRSRSLFSLASSKPITCPIILLDDTKFECQINHKTRGQVILEEVCNHLNLLEKDYFGLWYDGNDDPLVRCWIEPEKKVLKQLTRFAKLPYVLNFGVKFYPDPTQLQEDISRYFLFQQVRRDVLSGKLPCSQVTQALLGSYHVQSELGDYDPAEHGPGYLADFVFSPHSSEDLSERVAELHRQLRGQTPAESELLYLENAKKLSMYGLHMYNATDSAGVEIKIGVCALGLHVYRDRLRINRFAWPKILKISYKRTNFYIKIRPGDFEQIESTIGFKLATFRAAKRLWKITVEHHTFFRLTVAETLPQNNTLLPHFGSKFRYSGRTQYQLRRSSYMIDRPPPPFSRSMSNKRYSLRSLDNENNRRANDRYRLSLMSSPSNSLKSPLSPEPIEEEDHLMEKTASNAMLDQTRKQPQYRKPIGGVAVLPPIDSKEAKRQSQLVYDYEPGRRSTLDQYPDQNGTGAPIGPATDSRSRGLDTQSTPLTSTPTIGVHARSNGDRRPFEWRTSENAYTREYSYTVNQQQAPPATNMPSKLAGAFSYAPNGSAAKSGDHPSPVVPGSEMDGSAEPRRATARAFTYKPPDSKPVTGKPPTPSKLITSGKDSPNVTAKENRSPLFTTNGRTGGDHHVEQVKSSRSETRQFAQLIQTGKEQRQELQQQQQEKRETKSIDKMNALFGSSKSAKKSEPESKTTSSIFGTFGRSRSETSPTSGQGPTRKTTDLHSTSMKQSLESDSDTDSQKSSENSMDEYATEDVAAASAAPITSRNTFGSSDRLKQQNKPSPTFSSISGPRHSSSTMTQSQTTTRSFDHKSSSGTQGPTVSQGPTTTTTTTTTSGSSRVKEAVMQKERTVSKQVTESSKTITGKLEDIYPLIKNEAIRYGHPADQELKLPTKSVPVVTSETRKSQYSTTSGSNWHQQQQQQNVTQKTVDPVPVKTYGSTVGRGTPSTRYTTGPIPTTASTTAPTVMTSSPKPQTAPKPSLDALKRAGSPLVFGRPAQPEASASATSPTNTAEANKAAKRRFLSTGPGTTIPNVVASEKMSESSVSNKTKTVETVTYKVEKDGIIETRVEQKITIQSDGEPVDCGKAVEEAIQDLGSDMTLEKIEIQQKSTIN